MERTWKIIASIFFLTLLVGGVAFAAFNNVFVKENNDVKDSILPPINEINFSKKDQDFLEDFRVNEWGVFYQKYNSNFTYLLNPGDNDKSFEPPDNGIRPLKPVIYFHNKNNLSYVTVEVEISEDLITIPQAKIAGNKIRWTFSLVDNKIFLENGSIFDYLFYEGKINCSQPISAFVYVNGSNISYYIKNNADYPLSNIFLNYCYTTIGSWAMKNSNNTDPIESPVIPRGYIEPAEIEAYIRPFVMRNNIFIEKLEPGESVFITKTKILNTDCFNYSLVRDVLNNTNLTEKEIADLMDYWEDIWFEPEMVFDENDKKWKQKSIGISDSAQILYMISEETYDSFLPIKISPKPEFLERIGLFYITDIPVKYNLKNDTYM